MALMQCPECGKDSSNKITACPHCGYPLVDVSELQQVNVALSKSRPMDPALKRKLLIGAIISAIVIIIAIISFISFKHVQAEKEKEEYLKKRAEYLYVLSQASTRMLEFGSTAESMCNRTRSVWGNTIYKKSDSKTDRYTMKNGKFNEDFNDSIDSLCSDPNMIKLVDALNNLVRQFQRICAT